MSRSKSVSCIFDSGSSPTAVVSCNIRTRLISHRPTIFGSGCSGYGCFHNAIWPALCAQQLHRALLLHCFPISDPNLQSAFEVLRFSCRPSTLILFT